MGIKNDAVALGLCAVALALLLALWPEAPRRYTIGTPGDEVVALRFWPPDTALEGPARWTRAAGTLRQFGREASGPALVTLRLNGLGGPAPPLVTLSQDSTVLARMEVPPGWRRYHMPCRPPQAPWGTPLLHLQSIAPGSPDAPERGVAVSELASRPLGGRRALPTLERAGLYTCILLLLFALSRQARRAGPILRPWLPALLIGTLLRVAWAQAGLHRIEWDAVEYHLLAAQVAAGQPYGLQLWSPGWPMVLGLLYRHAGASVRAGVWLNVALSVATTLLCGLLARRLFGARAGGFCVWLVALMPSFIMLNALLMYEVWLQFLLVLGLWLALRGPWRWTTSLALACVAALAALVRPFWLPLPLLLWWVARGVGRPAGGWRPLVAAQLGALLLLSPWVIAASAGAGQLVPVAANGGVNLWIGNSPGATGGYILPPPQLSDPRNAGRAQDEALAYIRDHPDDVARLLPEKLEYLLREEYSDGIMNTGALAPDAVAYIRRLMQLSYLVVCVLAIGAIGALLQRDRRLLYPLALFAYNIASYLPFFGDARYRWPLQFLLILYAAALPSLLRAGAQPRRRPAHPAASTARRPQAG